MSQSNYLIKDELLTKLSNDELLAKIADDLVNMHNDTGIDLAYWNVAYEVVRRHYPVGLEVKVGTKNV
jgi:hypothetical protein